jgi:hypothetical protein
LSIVEKLAGIIAIGLLYSLRAYRAPRILRGTVEKTMREKELVKRRSTAKTTIK